MSAEKSKSVHSSEKNDQASIDSSERIAHLEMLQGVINRLASNSSLMKTLAGTITAAAIALYGTIDGAKFTLLVAVAFPVIVFWILDARYLAIERAYRNLYNAVRGEKPVEKFSMNYRSEFAGSESLFGSLVSWSIFWFYATILLAFTVIHYFSVAPCSS
jgi:hypothetical protein